MIGLLTCISCRTKRQLARRKCLISLFQRGALRQSGLSGDSLLVPYDPYTEVSDPAYMHVSTKTQPIRILTFAILKSQLETAAVDIFAARRSACV